jgi:hypothetical protein
MTHIYTNRMLRNLALSATAMVALAACGGGASTEQNEQGNTGPRGAGSAYPSSAPPAANDDVTAFRIHVWERFYGEAGCAGCHASSSTNRNFATATNINDAYANVMGTLPGVTGALVNLDDVSQSRMVTFVRGGHSCWIPSSADPNVNPANLCADEIEQWIRNWRATQSGTQINLQAPPMADPVSSRAWPVDADDGNPSFQATVYPLLSTYCSSCHSPNAATRQQPYLGSSDANQSYEAARPRMNLDVPALSRLVQRLREESHNCWVPQGGTAVDCAANATDMETRIANFAAGIAADPIPSEWVTSRALGMLDGTLATGGARFDENIIAKYEFKEGAGAQARDTSGVEPLMHLDLYDTPMGGGVTFAAGWGLQLAGGRAQAQVGPSTKLHQNIGLTGEYSVEVWAAPANVVQNNARRIVTYSGNAGAAARNFTLGQSLYNYNALSSSSMLSTPDDARSAQASLQHVVVTFSASGGRRIYVNGEFTNAVDSVGSALGAWADTYAFAIGNEVGVLDGATAWHGTLRFVAIHNRALTPEQVRQNFDVGIGEKYFVLFSVGHLIDDPQGYIMFTVTRYDGYSYLFDQPKYISLDPDALPNDLVIRGMRIGVNGREPTVGQAYAKLNVTVTNAMYLPQTGASLSTVGTIIPLEFGPGAGTAGDQFFLTFEQIGDEEDARTEPTPATPAPPANVPRPSDIGVRTFDAINETFSQITGVSKNTTSVRNTYLTVKQALPAAETFQAFLASHQTAVAQLAIAYCSAMVDNTAPNVGARDVFYGRVIDMSSPLTNPTHRGYIIDPVLDRAMGTGLLSQPGRVDAYNELDLLIDNTDTQANDTDNNPNTYRALGLCRVPGGCGSGRTALVMKAVCGAGLASAVTTVQ